MSRPSVNGVLHAAIFTGGMIVFGLCAHRGDLWTARFLGLMLAGVGLAMAFANAPRHLARQGDLLGLKLRQPSRLIYLPICIVLGIALAVVYRDAQDRELLPVGLTLFALMSVGIGLCEELAFRGAVQSSLRNRGAWFACLGSAAAHTSYKCSLFIFPAGAERANLLVLAIGTLAVGALFGLMRERLGSVWFPVAAHVAFEVAC